jgi:hypothetical protein
MLEIGDQLVHLINSILMLLIRARMRSILKIRSEVAGLPEEIRHVRWHAGDARRNDWLSLLAHQSTMDRLDVVYNVRVNDIRRVSLV